jgi:glycosyltransferase involved in cell wall biosynthesis
MRIGIFPNLNAHAGGVYQYNQSVLHALNAWNEDGCAEQFVLFWNDTRHPSLIPLKESGWEIKPRESRPLRQEVVERILQALGEGPHREALRWVRRQASKLNSKPVCEPPDPNIVQYRSDLRKRFLRSKLDFLIYPQPTPVSFESGFPYVMAVHDLQHRLQPEFPEVSADGEWQRREYLFRNGCRNATLVLADSEVGREDVLAFYGRYGISEDRIKILPYLPPPYITGDVSEGEQRRVRAVYDLPVRYLFYPAQFWPHKNHRRIVEALHLLKHERKQEIPIVFCGSHAGEIREQNFCEVMSLSKQLGVEKQILYLGYVADHDISSIYAQAAGLIMPTFFGPTNIPILEAWASGCPVLTSDIRGVRDQAGDAAILVDPRSSESIAEGIHRLWANESLAGSLIKSGRQQLADYTPDDFRRRLTEIITEAKTRVRAQQRQSAHSQA